MRLQENQETYVFQTKFRNVNLCPKTYTSKTDLERGEGMRQEMGFKKWTDYNKRQEVTSLVSCERDS